MGGGGRRHQTQTSMENLYFMWLDGVKAHPHYAVFHVPLRPQITFFEKKFFI